MNRKNANNYLEENTQQTNKYITMDTNQKYIKHLSNCYIIKQLSL